MTMAGFICGFAVAMFLCTPLGVFVGVWLCDPNKEGRWDG